MPKIYAVAKGKKPGVFFDWPSAQEQISGYSGAVHKSFNTAVVGWDKNVMDYLQEYGDVTPKTKFYGVAEGRTKGVFVRWPDASEQVSGYESAKYKKFDTLTDAMSFAGGIVQKVAKSEQSITFEDVATADVSATPLNGPYAFVDGSFNPDTGVYGYGGFLCVNGRHYPLVGSGNEPGMSAMRNVAGEIEGSMAAVRKAESLGVREMTLLYDYKGIEEWATGAWSANKPETAAYRDFMNPAHRSVHVAFEKVAAHTGIEGNEMADVMAKSAVGIDLTRQQQALYERAMAMGNRDGLDISGIQAHGELTGEKVFDS